MKYFILRGKIDILLLWNWKKKKKEMIHYSSLNQRIKKKKKETII